jgi:tetratricopeptide (TPR) repeat protein
MKIALIPAVYLLLSFACFCCQDKPTAPSAVLIKGMDLKICDVISCGPDDQQLGTLSFEITCNKDVSRNFLLALKLLHSFEYDEAEKVFAGIIDKNPECAMAYWGVAMSNFHPLWAPPTEAELKKGAKAIEIANSIKEKSEKESAYIATIASYYANYEKTDHRSRCLNFEKAMEQLHAHYPDDKEASVFYALALNAAADPTDKTFAKQKKAGDILMALYPGQPDHPGIVHYIIHTYDAPELAHLGLNAARRYASIAPSSAHALHMPSHIFTRLGLWAECISSNLASVNSAQCYAQSTGIKGHWDEELHGLDYLMYAYLQRGQNDLATKQLAYLDTIKEIHPANFKVAYAFAAIPARYMLENKNWSSATTLKFYEKNFSWKDFPWQKSIVHFTRIMGAVHTGNKDVATTELAVLKQLHQELLKQKDNYKAGQVEIQMNTAEAWIQFMEGKNEAALEKMNLAANAEDKTEKHPVTPGEVIPARELLGDLLMEMNKWEKALEVYELNLKRHPNRFNALHGAGLAAEKAGNMKKAKLYYEQLISVANQSNSSRTEINTAKQFLERTAAL